MVEVVATVATVDIGGVDVTAHTNKWRYTNRKHFILSLELPHLELEHLWAALAQLDAAMRAGGGGGGGAGTHKIGPSPCRANKGAHSDKQGERERVRELWL